MTRLQRMALIENISLNIKKYLEMFQDIFYNGGDGN